MRSQNHNLPTSCPIAGQSTPWDHMAPFESLKAQLCDMLHASWRLVIPYEGHSEWPSTPPSKSTGYARNGVTRFHFQVLIIQCLESGRRLRSSQRKTSVVGVDLICESQNKNGPSRPVFLAHRQNAGAVSLAEAVSAGIEFLKVSSHLLSLR